MPSPSTETFPSAGKSIRIHIIEPAITSNTAGPVPAVLLLHGAGGNVSFWLDHLGPAVARLGVAVYALQYFDSTGIQHASPALLADGVSIPIWLQTVRDSLTWISQRQISARQIAARQTAGHPTIEAQRIGLIGISLGAFLSLALGTEAAAGFPVRAIVDVSGGLLPPWNAQATPAYPPTLILHGETDTVVPVSNAHALDALLTSLAVPHQLQTFPNEGHWFSVQVQLRMLVLIGDFLRKHL